MSTQHRIASITQWAKRVGLADDGRSIATARTLIASDDGPKTVKIGQREGVRNADHDAWIRERPWAEYLTSLAAPEREKRRAQAVRIVSSVPFTARLYDRYRASRWCQQMTFEKWLERRQRLKDRTKAGQRKGSK